LRLKNFRIYRGRQVIRVITETFHKNCGVWMNSESEKKIPNYNRRKMRADDKIPKYPRSKMSERM